MSTKLAVLARSTQGRLFTPGPNLLTLEPYKPFRIPAGTGATPGHPIEPSWDSDRAVREGLKASAILSATIGRVAEKAASVTWREWRVSRSGTEEPMDPVPWIEQPRRDGKISRFQLMELAHYYLFLSGNALFGVLWEGGRFRFRPREIHLENPHGCRPIPHRLDWISGYEWDDTAIGGPRYWDASDVFHVIGRPDPAMPYWGWSIVEALATTVDADREARRLNFLRYRRGGYPGTIIGDPDITQPEDAKEWEDHLNRRAEDFFGSFMVLGGQQKVHPSKPLTEEELGLLKGMAAHRDEIAWAIGFHPALFSSEAATFDNMNTARELEWRIAVLRNARVADVLTRRTVPRSEFGKRFIAPDYSDVEELQGLASKISNVKDMVSNCRIAVNDAIVAAGLPVSPQAGGDRPLVQANMIPADEAAESLSD